MNAPVKRADGVMHARCMLTGHGGRISLSRRDDHGNEAVTYSAVDRDIEPLNGGWIGPSLPGPSRRVKPTIPINPNWSEI